MSNTYTPNLALAQPAQGDRSWNTPVNGNSTILDNLNAIGDLSVTTAQQPSTNLQVNVAAGLYLNQAGAVSAYAGNAGVSMTGGGSNYLYLTNGGTFTVSTVGWPASPTLYIPIANVVAGASTITSITDYRAPFTVAGPAWLPTAGGAMTDGANVSLGTGTGTQIGTAASQKIGFYGTTPVIQPTLGVATATGTYGSNEEGMLQRVYNAVRALGLGS